MEGHFISGYADGLNKPETPIELKANVADEALAFLNCYPETNQRFGRVSDLIQGVRATKWYVITLNGSLGNDLRSYNRFSNG